MLPDPPGLVTIPAGIHTNRLMLTRGQSKTAGKIATLLEPFSRQLHSLVSLFPRIHGMGDGISPAGWRVMILLFLLLAAFPREQLDSEALRYVTLLGMAENRGECSLLQEKRTREDASIVETVETVETDLARERRVRSNGLDET